MKAGELGIIQVDKIAQDAHYIFSMKVAMHKGKKPLDYEVEAKQAFLAAEAFVKVGTLNGHLKYTPPAA